MDVSQLLIDALLSKYKAQIDDAIHKHLGENNG